MPPSQVEYDQVRGKPAWANAQTSGNKNGLGGRKGSDKTVRPALRPGLVQGIVPLKDKRMNSGKATNFERVLPETGDHSATLLLNGISQRMLHKLFKWKLYNRKCPERATDHSLTFITRSLPRKTWRSLATKHRGCSEERTDFMETQSMVFKHSLLAAERGSWL